MPSSTPSSASRYRPAILVLTGAAAAYAAYLLYSTFQTSPSNSLQRSNAVRRRVRPRDSPSARALSLSIAHYAHEIPSLGEYNLLGTRIPLDSHNLVPIAELRHVIAQADPNAREEAIETAIGDLYDVFLDRLVLFLFPSRAPSQTEVEAIQRWIGDRIPDNTAVARAAERHAERFPPGENLAVDGAESVAATELSWRSDEDTEGDTIDPDGQTLQRTLYHIAEDRARHEGVIHRGITCNGCDEKPIRGVRWHCANCVDFDLCSNCEATNSHYKTHIFYKIRVPAPYLGLPKQEPLYPGKPHMMSPSIDTPLKKRLVSETKMEAEEIEALWDQFSCLAGTEWADDTSGVGWALDRRAFDHAFVPRYNSFVAAPNLIYDRIFAYYDADKNGLIGFVEWIKGIDGMHTTDVEVKARIVFNGYDIDRDDYISRKDILRIFRAFYAIEKEATRNYVAELTEDLSVRNALETIRSSQPLGSAFPPPPHNMAAANTPHPWLGQKAQDDENQTTQVLEEDSLDVADREDILRATDLHYVIPGDVPRNEQERIVTDRWARRQFYVDEEEGLARPEGAVDGDSTGEAVNDEARQDEGPHNSSSENERRRWSRSSSRVRFQDDVDVETRSNASTSSRPVGERWGGYEIPEAEKDLGKEVLYQITQQGFNELLNPLFQDKEDMAMDVHATCGDRRKHAAAIEEADALLKTTRIELECLIEVGIFRFSKCVVDMFCKALNSGAHYENIRALFQNDDGTEVTQDEARSRLADVYASVEKSALDSIDRVHILGKDTPDKITLWNAILYKQQLEEETLNAVLDCVSYLGWIAWPSPHEKPTVADSLEQAQAIYRDPTMPQFRPNSQADIDALRSSSSNSASSCDESQDSDESSTSGSEEIVEYRNAEGVEHIASDPQGPFFVFTVPEKPSNAEEQTEPAEGDAGSSPASPAQRTVLIIPADEPASTEAPTSPTLPPTPDPPTDQPPRINWSSYTNNPSIHLIFVDANSGVDVLRSSPRPVTHSTNPYQAETDPAKTLIRHIRQLAMDPDSRHHVTLLASLETMEEEMKHRKGSGLISFEEFAEHLRQGRLRFLESWMNWVSI
ncbi:Nn.00g035090.m01.CDS01 [Neocucurbitaria sp. VM-36]